MVVVEVVVACLLAPLSILLRRITIRSSVLFLLWVLGGAYHYDLMPGIFAPYLTVQFRGGSVGGWIERWRPWALGWAVGARWIEPSESNVGHCME